MISKLYSWIWRELFTITLKSATQKLYVHVVYERERIQSVPWERRRFVKRTYMSEMLNLAGESKLDDHFWNCLAQTIVCCLPHVARNIKTRRWENLEFSPYTIVDLKADHILHLWRRRISHDKLRVRRDDLNNLLKEFGA